MVGLVTVKSHCYGSNTAASKPHLPEYWFNMQQIQQAAIVLRSRRFELLYSGTAMPWPKLRSTTGRAYLYSLVLLHLSDTRLLSALQRLRLQNWLRGLSLLLVGLKSLRLLSDTRLLLRLRKFWLLMQLWSLRLELWHRDLRMLFGLGDLRLLSCSRSSAAWGWSCG